MKKIYLTVLTFAAMFFAVDAYAQLGLGAGVTLMDKFDVKLGYNIGLLNRYTGEQIDNFKYKTHTGVFYVGVGFNF